MKLNLLVLGCLFAGAAVIADGFDNRIVPFTSEHMEKCVNLCLKEMRDRLAKKDFAGLQTVSLKRLRNSADFVGKYVRNSDDDKDWGAAAEKCINTGLTELRDKITADEYSRLQIVAAGRRAEAVDVNLKYKKQAADEEKDWAAHEKKCGPADATGIPEKDWAKYEVNCHLHGNTPHCALH